MRYLRGFCYLLIIVAVVGFLIFRATRTHVWYAPIDLIQGSTRVSDLFKGMQDCFPESAKMDFGTRIEMSQALRGQACTFEWSRKTPRVRITVHADSGEKAVALANAMCEAAILESQEMDRRILDEARAAARKRLEKPGGDPELRARLERFLAAADACTDRTLKPLDRKNPKPLDPTDAWEVVR